MSINILLSLNIQSCHSPLFLLASHAKVPNGMLNKTILRGAAFWSSELAAQNRYHSFYKGNKGWRGCVKFGQWAQGNRTWDLGYHAPSVFATQNITQLPTSTGLLPTFTKTTLKYRIMNGLKECIWKQREPNYTPSCNRVPRSYTK